MPAAKVTISGTGWVLVATTTKDTLVTNDDLPKKLCIGATAGVTYDMGTPFDRNEKIIVPSGVSVYAMTPEGRTAYVWWTDFAA